MPVIVIPNVSEGRRPKVVESLAGRVADAGARVLDVHSDPTHNRSVLTVTGESRILPDAMLALADGCRRWIDLRRHEGIHPRFGVLDVCPFVPVTDEMGQARTLAVETARSLGDAGIPVHLYGEASEGSLALPAVRKMLATSDAVPDYGPRRIDPATGVICVGARGPLIAFNVWLRAEARTAEGIARSVRASSGGLPGVRALGLAIDERTSQVSMNLTTPDITGIDEVFDRVAELARAQGAEVTASEIVGLVPERYMPDPNREAARCLKQPSRSLESAIADL